MICKDLYDVHNSIRIENDSGAEWTWLYKQNTLNPSWLSLSNIDSIFG